MHRSLIKARKKMGIICLVFFCLSILGLVGRIGWIQFVDGAKMKEMVKNQLVESQALLSPRGMILDRTGRQLAVSIMTKSLYIDGTRLNKDADTLAALLAPVLQMNPAKIKERVAAAGSFMWLKRTLEPEEYKAVAALIQAEKITGLDFVEESKRYYPNNTLAAHVLGFVGTDDKGLDGIEMTRDKLLKGQTFKQQLETDSHGIPIFRSIFDFRSEKPGQSLVLTIDTSIQFIVENSLDKVMRETGAQGATIIVMNPKTGEVLAMASRPTYNPNFFEKYTEKDMTNRAVSSLYEPGSTFKSIVAAAAFQEKLVSADEMFYDKGYVEIGDKRIKNWSDESYGRIPFLEIIKNSINTGFVEVGLRLGGTRLLAYADKFGFGRSTDIELPGEGEGILFKADDIKPIDVATMSIGQGIAVTPLQMLTAVCAIANDGMLLKPYIIREIQQADGTLVSATPTRPVGQAIQPETARNLIGLLEKVVSEGGAQKAKVPGYRFAGKTGTAERIQEGGGYAANRYIASFVGFGPVENPELAALVVIDSPLGVYYGGQIAAPVFSEMMTQILRYMGIPASPGLIDPVPEPPVKQEAAVPKEPPKEAVPAKTIPPDGGRAWVPDVRGMTLREAGQKITKEGLNFIPVGSGVVVRQSVAPYTDVDTGTAVTVWLEER